jgi:hypothetical protein
MRRLPGILVLAFLGAAACKATGNSQVSEAPPAEASPLFVCSATDAQRPLAEVEIFPTGFDAQLGMTVEAVVRGASATASGEQVLEGHGEVDDEKLEMLLDHGTLTADAVPATKAGQDEYVGTLDLDSGISRPMRCL